MICVDHLCYHYKGGRPILRDVSFELETGHFLAVLGNNGVGKSTLLKCMNRILTADSGHCRIDGEDLLTLSHREIAKRVAFVAQHVPDRVLCTDRFHLRRLLRLPLFYHPVK